MEKESAQFLFTLFNFCFIVRNLCSDPHECVLGLCGTRQVKGELKINYPDYASVLDKRRNKFLLLCCQYFRAYMAVFTSFLGKYLKKCGNYL